MELTDWLLRQIPAIIIMGVIIYVMFRYIQTKDKVIKAKDITLMSLAEKSLTVAAMWDVKSQLNSEEHKDILIKVGEIRDIVKLLKTNGNNGKS